jgi:ribosome recycling factor
MKMDEILLETEESMEKTINNLKDRLTNIRAGRANPSMLDPVKVMYYGAETPLNQIANISVPEARKLQIKPYDKSCLSDIEKGIYEANLGLTPNNTGDMIFISIPELTEDRRKELVKQAKVMSEEAKVALRNIRQDAMSDVKKLELNEDEEKRAEKEVQDLINKYNKIVDDVLSNKEEELMTI